MSWRMILKRRGMMRIAASLGITYIAVRKWEQGLSLPAGKNLKNLVALMRRDLPSEEFGQFISTLQRDLLGMDPHV